MVFVLFVLTKFDVFAEFETEYGTAPTGGVGAIRSKRNRKATKSVTTEVVTMMTMYLLLYFERNVGLYLRVCVSEPAPR